MFSIGDSRILRPLCNNIENVYKNYYMRGLLFEDIHDALIRKVMRNENKAMVWKYENGVDEKCFVSYEQSSRAHIATGVENTAFVAYPEHDALMIFTFLFISGAVD